MIDISSLPFSLVINGIDRTANVISIELQQDELSEDGLILTTGTINLKGNFNQRTEFTYLASPAIGANWARGASVVYTVDGAPFVISGSRLFILKEPAPPNANNEISLQIGDEAALLNYPSADQDLSGVTAGQNTDRDEVITNYLNGANVQNSISNIDYPFDFPQPKLEGQSLVAVAAQMARASNHYLYTNASGTLVNSALDLNATAIATFTISEDEEIFEPIDSSGMETPVDELVVSGVATSIESETYPKTTVTDTIRTFINSVPIFIGSFLVGFDTRKYRFVSKRVTITDYGWDGNQERIEILNEATTLSFDREPLTRLELDPAALLQPQSFVTQTQRYDSLHRLIEQREEKDIWVSSTAISRDFFSIRNVIVRNRVSAKDIVTTYQYSESDVLTNKREETINYNVVFNFSNDPTNDVFSRTAKEETWSDGTYTVQNFFQATVYESRLDSFSYSIQAKLGEWGAGNGETIYSTDGSTQAPQTVYRKPFEVKERQISVKIKAQPFAGDSFKSRSRPVDVPYLVSESQATEYANTYLALLYGRKSGFIFATGYIPNIKPLARINIIWNGVIYECLADGVTWEHTKTKATMAMSLIVLRTALVATPSVVAPLAVAAPLITAIAQIIINTEAELIIDNALFGTATIQINAFAALIDDLALQAVATIQINATGV